MRKKELLFERIFLTSAGVSVVSLALITFFIFWNALPAFMEIGLGDFLLSKSWAPTDEPPSFGILPEIVGTLYVTMLAALMGAPIGIFTAVYMVFYAPLFLNKPLKAAVGLMAGVPSIVYGFFGLVLLAPVIRDLCGGTGVSLLAAALILAIMILPTIISVSCASLKAIPPECYENAVALGATHERSIFFAVLPAAKKGVISAVALGVCRAIGETMAVVMVAGNQARMPSSLFKGFRSMTSHIVLEMGYAAELHRDALFATAFTLLLMVFAINAFIQWKT